MAVINLCGWCWQSKWHRCHENISSKRKHICSISKHTTTFFVVVCATKNAVVKRICRILRTAHSWWRLPFQNLFIKPHRSSLRNHDFQFYFLGDPTQSELNINILKLLLFITVSLVQPIYFILFFQITQGFIYGVVSSRLQVKSCLASWQDALPCPTYFASLWCIKKKKISISLKLTSSKSFVLDNWITCKCTRIWIGELRLQLENSEEDPPSCTRLSRSLTEQCMCEWSSFDIVQRKTLTRNEYAEKTYITPMRWGGYILVNNQIFSAVCILGQGEKPDYTRKPNFKHN